MSEHRKRPPAAAAPAAATPFPVVPYALLLLAALCFAGNNVVGRAIHAEVPPIALNFWRWLFVAMVLAPLAFREAWRQRRLIRAHWRMLAAVSASGVALFNTFLYIGLHTTTAINSGLIGSTLPAVMIPILAFLFFRDPARPRQVFGIAASAVGVLILIVHGEWSNLIALRFTAGDLWMVAAALNWALFSVFLARLPPAFSPMLTVALIASIGVVMLLPAYLGELSAVGGFELTRRSVLGVGYVALVPSLFAFACYQVGVARVGATKAGMFIYMVPVFVVVLAVVFLDERFEPYHMAGGGFIFTGILLTIVERRQPAPVG